MTAILDLDRVALILVEAAFFGDKATISRWGISRRTVYNYRQLLTANDDLAHKFTIKKREFESKWADEIPIAVKKGIRFILDSFDKLEPTAENLYAVTGAVKVLTEIGLTKEIIDARLAGYNRENGTQDSQLVAGPNSQASNSN